MNYRHWQTDICQAVGLATLWTSHYSRVQEVPTEVCLHGSNGRLAIEATDGIDAVRLVTSIPWTPQGEYVVESRFLLASLRGLPNAQITAGIDERMVVVVYRNGTRIRLYNRGPRVDLLNWNRITKSEPLFEVDPGVPTLTIDTSQFVRAARRVNHISAPGRELGMTIVVKDDAHCYLYMTDASRLHEALAKCKGSTFPKDVSFPQTAILRLIQLGLAGGEPTMTVSVKNGSYLARCGGMSSWGMLWTHQIEPYRAILDLEMQSAAEVSVDRNHFLAALRAVYSWKQVTLTFLRQELRLQAKRNHRDAGEIEFNVSLAAKGWTGPRPWKVGFDPSFLRSAASLARDATVRLRLKPYIELSPVLLLNQDGDFRALIMPLRL